MIEVPAEENPFTALPTSAASDLQWRLMDCDGDGDLDLIRLNKSMQINACEREGDALKCSSNFECLEWASEYEKSAMANKTFANSCLNSGFRRGSLNE